MAVHERMYLPRLLGGQTHSTQALKRYNGLDTLQHTNLEPTHQSTGRNSAQDAQRCQNYQSNGAAQPAPRKLALVPPKITAVSQLSVLRTLASTPRLRRAAFRAGVPGLCACMLGGCSWPPHSISPRHPGARLLLKKRCRFSARSRRGLSWCLHPRTGQPLKAP